MPGVLEKIKSAYLVWHDVHIILPQVNRYTLGNKIDKLFIEVIENTATAAFSRKEDQMIYVKRASKKLETLKILLMVLWETKSITNKKYIELSLALDEIGRMLGGWNNQLLKQNFPAEARKK